MIYALKQAVGRVRPLLHSDWGVQFCWLGSDFFGSIKGDTMQQNSKLICNFEISFNSV